MALTIVSPSIMGPVTGTGSVVLSISPTFTGTPSVPTATVGTSTTQIATTAFVQGLLVDPALTGNATINAIKLGYRNVPQNIQSGAYTFVLGDNGKHIYSANAGAQALTLPLNSSVAFDIGTAISVINNGTTALSFTTTGVTVYKAGTSAAWASGGTMAVRGMATLLKVAADVWFISGAGLS